MGQKKNVLGSIIVTILVILISVIIAIGLILFLTDYMGMGGSKDEIPFEVSHGDTSDVIIQGLKEWGIITNQSFFKTYLKFSNKDLESKSGTHILNSAMSYSDIFEKLTSSPTSPSNEEVTLRFVEGITLNQVAQMLEENNICPANEFLTAFNTNYGNYDFEEFANENSLKFNRFEGYFFPDTYNFLEQDNPEIIVSMLRKVFADKIYRNYSSKIAESGYEFDEIITLASLIQKEAGNLEDMKMVSSVFHNRLNKPNAFPKLQSDPTTNFAKQIIGASSENPSQAMMDAYDTYIADGLPPGAICNPGENAIIAALEPAESEYYYFCADLNTGEIYYAKTLEGHEENLVKANLR